MSPLQEEILKIYKKVKQICDDNNLRYFAIGGTCIGSIRHRGFIPWDDDLDIAMPRKDYEKFKIIAKKELPYPLEYKDEKGFAHNECHFSKVHNTETTLIHKNMVRFPDRDSGIYIDIMPLDGLPNNTILRIIHLKLLKSLIKLNFWRKGIAQPNKWYKKVIPFIVKPFPFDFFLNIYLLIVKKYDFDDKKNKLSCFAWSQRCEKLILVKNDFDDSVSFMFEDTLMKCPIGYDHYLVTHFGNYMDIPSKEEQINHENEIVRMDQSYRTFREERRNNIE
ncbi:LicD family protein [Enterococcus casseliflavus]|uniref:LicD family protein n=1 Tax=Enterococcus casseliflavus TaxID=37734 RepID=UPI001BCBB59D|nr:LicD family protein [Enterococcus casseliflavus]